MIYTIGLENKKKAVLYRKDFERIFSIRFMSYFNMLTGFDIVKFDEQFLCTPDGQSAKDIVTIKYGQEGLTVIEKLLS
ncbi:MAG: hypothetical protein ABIC57_00605 [bacterium]